jgi:hypothetical protein
MGTVRQVGRARASGSLNAHEPEQLLTEPADHRAIFGKRETCREPLRCGAGVVPCKPGSNLCLLLLERAYLLFELLGSDAIGKREAFRH